MDIQSSLLRVPRERERRPVDADHEWSGLEEPLGARSVNHLHMRLTFIQGNPRTVPTQLDDASPRQGSELDARSVGKRQDWLSRRVSNRAATRWGLAIYR